MPAALEFGASHGPSGRARCNLQPRLKPGLSSQGPSGPHAHTPTRPHAHTPTRPHAHTPTRPHAYTPTRPHAATPSRPPPLYARRYTGRQLVSFARRLNRPSRSSWDSDCGRWNNKRLVFKITAKETRMTSSKLQIEGLLSNL
jgi:hypothetical protein